MYKPWRVQVYSTVIEAIHRLSPFRGRSRNSSRGGGVLGRNSPRGGGLGSRSAGIFIYWQAQKKNWGVKPPTPPPRIRHCHSHTSMRHVSNSRLPWYTARSRLRQHGGVKLGIISRGLFRISVCFASTLLSMSWLRNVYSLSGLTGFSRGPKGINPFLLRHHTDLALVWGRSGRSRRFL